MYSRLGPYRLDLLDELAYQRRELFEYSGHRASLLPMDLFPVFRHNMERHTKPADTPGRDRFRQWAQANRKYVNAAYKEVTKQGPLSASELSDPGKSRGPWWPSKGKLVLEWLFWIGKVTVAERRNFERVYDLTERVIPSKALDSRLPAEQARRELFMTAARALGVATIEDVAGYFFMGPKMARELATELVADGSLSEARVEGWSKAAYVPSDVKIPPAVSATALVSPFDSLVWDRKRTARLFGFDYTIEIYVPAPKRKYGYYVLPFLLGDRFAGRVDLKADRASKTLLVLAAHLEPGADRDAVLPALADELRLMASWLGLDSVKVAGRGRVNEALRRSVG